MNQENDALKTKLHELENASNDWSLMRKEYEGRMAGLKKENERLNNELNNRSGENE